MIEEEKRDDYKKLEDYNDEDLNSFLASPK